MYSSLPNHIACPLVVIESSVAYALSSLVLTGFTRFLLAACRLKTQFSQANILAVADQSGI